MLSQDGGAVDVYAHTYKSAVHCNEYAMSLVNTTRKESYVRRTFSLRGLADADYGNVDFGAGFMKHLGLTYSFK